MPAFDPVRDAVLNSPLTRTKPLPHLLTSSPFPTVQSPQSASERPTISPLGRRATDLSMLLNSDLESSPSLFTPTSTTTRSTHLSHILQSEDAAQDRLAHLEPLTRKLSSDSLHRPSESSSTYFTEQPARAQQSPRSPRTTHSPLSQRPYTELSSTLPSLWSAGGSMSRPSSSSSSVSQQPSKPQKPAPTLRTISPVMPPPPPPNVLPYNPRHRITPAGSVLVPLSAAEIEMYRHKSKGTPLSSKRKREGNDEEERTAKRSRDAGIVVEHYNGRPEVGVELRQESPIIGLKSFNNWIKSVLITRFAHPAFVSSASRGKAKVSGKILDMGCGKGGDLNKWGKARIKEFIGLDIAAVSVDQARARWETTRGHRFEATFAALDCYTESISKALPPAKLAEPFDVVSMQFCMHYAFESVHKARCMLENATKWLRPGGIFVGTIPNAKQLLARLDEIPSDSDDLSFGNSVYTIRFDERTKRPTFGHRYWFFLKDAVEDVPEYIVHWKTFEEMANEYGLRLLYKREFHEVFEEHHEHAEFGPLLQRMNVVGKDGESQMDEDQWEAANIYIAFAFEKQ